MRGRKDNRIGAATRYKRKWFQVTRVSASLPAGMHGMKLRSRERRTFRLSAPQPALSSPAGSMPPGTPQPFFSLSWDRLLETAFHSPATKPAFTNSIPGSTFPACSFASYTSVPKLVRLLAPLPVTVRPVPAASLLKPVARSLRRSIRLPPASAPRQDFYFPSVQSVQPAYRESVRLPNPPDCLSLPVSVSIASFGSGSSFQARSVSEACCSSNLLEPPSLCAGMNSRSTTIARSNVLFLNFELAQIQSVGAQEN